MYYFSIIVSIFILFVFQCEVPRKVKDRQKWKSIDYPFSDIINKMIITTININIKVMVIATNNLRDLFYESGI
jgi:hypothetical protein